MPTKREREYYRMGYKDGLDDASGARLIDVPQSYDPRATIRRKPKRKLSAWNKYVKANSKKPRFRYRNGKLNLKKMAIAFRKTPAGKKKRR
jgi:hypothetical protein